MSIVSNLIDVFKETQFTLREAYAANPSVNKESVRARITRERAIYYKGKGLYSD